MKKTGIIARHEFTTTIRRISYILLTLSFPVLGLLGMLVYMGVANGVGRELHQKSLRLAMLIIPAYSMIILVRMALFS